MCLGGFQSIQFNLVLVCQNLSHCAKITMRLIWIERLAQACAKSCIASSSLLGGFGPGVGRDWEGMTGFSLNCTSLVTPESTERTLPSTLRFSKNSVWITDPLSHEQRSRCGSQKVLKAVPAGYGRTVIGNGMKLQLELLNLEVTYVSNSRYL